MNESSPQGQAPIVAPRYGVAMLSIGIVLILYVGFLLAANYRSATSLRETMEEQRRLESGRRVAALQYFFSERRDDLGNLALSTELEGYYKSRALGSVLGLKVSLYSVSALFRQLIERKRIGSEAIYRRLVLLDAAGAVLADAGGKDASVGGARDWRGLLAPNDRGPRLLVLDQGRTVAISLAREARDPNGEARYAGQLLAFLDASLMLRRVLNADAAHERTFVATSAGERLEGVGCTLPPALSRLPVDARLADGALFAVRVGADSDREDMVALARQVPDTGFVLIDLMSAARVHGRLKPWHLLLGMAALAVVVLLGVLLILRLTVRAVALQAHLRESQRVESQLRESKEAAEAGNRAKTEFLANMSHELRDPMIGVLGMVQKLADTPLEPEQREHLAVVQDCADRLLKLIAGILAYSMAEAGTLPLEETDFSLRSLLEEMTDRYAVRAEERGLGYACIVERDVPDRLHTDLDRLHQILSELIGNAVKFTARGEVEIRVGLVARDTAGERLRFLVRDTGIGIPADRQGLLFRPFSQADASLTRRHDGAGLALANCRALADLMGGTLGVESREGEGARFWLELPASVARAGAGAAPPAADLPRVLVMDSLAIGRAALVETLAREGFQTGTAADMAEAMDALLLAEDAGEPFGRVLIALREPGGEADLLLDLVPRQTWRAPLRVLVLAPRSRQRGLELPCPGTVAVLTAPVRREALLEALGLGRSARLDPKILLVEDQPINQKVVLAALAKLGYRADLAENGALAVEAALHGGYDAVLMDVQMPVMDGLEATRRIRAAEAAGTLVSSSCCGHLPIVALTAYQGEVNRLQCLDAGMDQVMLKPIRSPEAMRVVLERYLRATPPGAA